MKKIFLYTVVGFSFLLGSQELIAQTKKDDKPKVELSKEEAKALKKQKKEMDPLFFKDLYEERAKLKRDNDALQRQITNIGTMMADKDKEVEALKAQLDSVKQQRQAAMAEAASKKAQVSTGGNNANEDYTKGLVFKVQVGDINEAKLSGDVFQGSEEYMVEKDDDGKLKYTLGYFKGYEEAEDFKKNLRKIGIKVAWIVAYRDGKKQNMKNALGK